MIAEDEMPAKVPPGLDAFAMTVRLTIAAVCRGIKPLWIAAVAMSESHRCRSRPPQTLPPRTTGVTSLNTWLTDDTMHGGTNGVSHRINPSLSVVVAVLVTPSRVDA